MSKINPKLCQEWFDARNGNARETLKADKGRLRSFFRWAIGCGHMPEGTLKCETPVSLIRLPKEDKKEPSIFTPAEAKALLFLAAEKNPELLVYLSLGFFTGIRPQELHRLTFAQIRLHDKMVDVTLSKTRKSRTVPLPANALAWLELAKAKGQWGEPEHLIAPSVDKVKRLRAQLIRVVTPNQNWKQDVMRHSCASYRYEQCHNLGVVAKELGNSP
ncbi:MAG TPA: tyrosine-type recombinase/integrase, partial [Verrucomicrobiae bacterium]|nr:tyrosine-type recombinase/integrase [Verrucomicrobiae bacterium]